ncbi:MAG: hypothetical protein QM820_27105 [Minicystis sp.]
MAPQRLHIVALAGFALTAFASSARADVIDQCLASHAQAQRLRIEGKLRAAQQELLVCAANACPAVVRGECGDGLVAVRRDIPTVVVGATGAGNHEVQGVRMIVDGATALDAQRGTAIELDPGPHELRFEAPGVPPVTQSVVIRQGEKNRLLSVTFPEPPAAAASSRPFPVASVVLGGVAVAGGVTFAALALSARSDVDHLRQTCVPHCPSSDVNAVRRKLIVADVSVGVGVVALAAATWLFFSRPPARVATGFDVRVTQGAAWASYEHTF